MVKENLVVLCSIILWKAEFVSDEVVYLAEKTSKQMYSVVSSCSL